MDRLIAVEVESQKAWTGSWGLVRDVDKKINREIPISVDDYRNLFSGRLALEGIGVAFNCTDFEWAKILMGRPSVNIFF